MFTNLSTDPNKSPRLVGELGDLSHAKVSSGEFKYSQGTEIFGEAEPADYIYQVIEGAVRTVAARLERFTCLAISSVSTMAISIGSQPKPSSTPRFALLNAKAWNGWPKPILEWFGAS